MRHPASFFRIIIALLSLSYSMSEEHYEITHNAPLNVLDDTKKSFTWRQVRTLLISSTGFFMDAYVFSVEGYTFVLTIVPLSAMIFSLSTW